MEQVTNLMQKFPSTTNQTHNILPCCPVQGCCQEFTPHCIDNCSLTNVVTDNFTTVVDCCPVQKCDSFTVWLVDIKPCFHQLSTACKGPILKQMPCYQILFYFQQQMHYIFAQKYIKIHIKIAPTYFSLTTILRQHIIDLS